MSDISKEITEKLDKIFVNVENMTYDEAIKMCEATILYLEGVATNADPLIKSSLTQIRLSIHLAKGIMITAKLFHEENDKLRTDLNNVMGRLSRLEKKQPFKDPEKLT